VGGGSLKVLGVVCREPDRVKALRAHGQQFIKGARARGLDVGSSWGFGVTPIILGTDIRTFWAAQDLEQRGVYVFPVIAPGVPEGTSRLRFFLSAAHKTAQIDAALDTLAAVLDLS
ncbi:MAG: aminotransferase class I/II-fold pyridoxal phosphate-dependent enzyme, partial [Alphaproteobacteria bacterium]